MKYNTVVFEKEPSRNSEGACLGEHRLGVRRLLQSGGLKPNVLTAKLILVVVVVVVVVVRVRVVAVAVGAAAVRCPNLQKCQPPSRRKVVLAPCLF